MADMIPKSALYGVYSLKQLELAGDTEWTTPSGETVLVTEVSPNPGVPKCHFDDKKDLVKLFLL